MQSVSKLPASAQRVAELLLAIGHGKPVILLPASGRTSAEAAAERGIEAEGTIAPVLSAGQVDDKIRLTWTYAPE